VSPEPFTGTQMILEAMSAGLPILAAESPDLHTMVEHGHNGLIVSAQDHDAWVAAISFLCDNLPLAAKMGGAGQEIIRQKFAAAEMAKRHLELFETLSRMKD
jgi:glycosyltransferase involved in cell wall biosynthesis